MEKTKEVLITAIIKVHFYTQIFWKKNKST